MKFSIHNFNHLVLVTLNPCRKEYFIRRNKLDSPLFMKTLGFGCERSHFITVIKHYMIWKFIIWIVMKLQQWSMWTCNVTTQHIVVWYMRKFSIIKTWKPHTWWSISYVHEVKILLTWTLMSQSSISTVGFVISNLF